MMLGLNGRAQDMVDTFGFFLAHKLGRTVKDLEEMPHDEYVGWQAYFEVRNALEGM